MVLPLGVVVRVLRERRVVEKLPLAWRTAVRPSRMHRRAHKGAVALHRMRRCAPGLGLSQGQVWQYSAQHDEAASTGATPNRCQSPCQSLRCVSPRVP